MRTRLAVQEIVRRVYRHVGEEGALEYLPAGKVSGGSVGETTFTIRYNLDGTTFRAKGRILEGARDRLVLLKFRRDPEKVLYLALVCGLGAVSVYLHQETPFDWVLWVFSVAGAVTTGLLYPRFGVVPQALVSAVAHELTRELIGKVE